MHCFSPSNANFANIRSNFSATSHHLSLHLSNNLKSPSSLFLHHYSSSSDRKTKTHLSNLSNDASAQLCASVGSHDSGLLVSKAAAETSVNEWCDKSVEEQEHMRLLESTFDANGLAFEVKELKMSEDSDIIIDERLLDILKEKCGRVVAAGEVLSSSRVLVCVGNEIFADQLALASPNSVDVFHLSLEVLARVKEKHDNFRCWHGELKDVLYGVNPYDVVFLNFLPAIAFDDAHLFRTIVHSCRPGAKVVVSHIMGSNHLRLQRERDLSTILRDLPNFMQLKAYCACVHMELLSFQDDHDFYLATLKVPNLGD
ncbi:hypothetical protein O6H91_18G021300 [Diphasiastrum complanatum]|uniref:Uncharacterized protein n=1 Tax=Diphasiastrum complanatum TaxID=34168 RepID=A0ACC2AZX0_DIPCM|nr:hypothetical protein O6H91_18G021300 [Diphasiastrum complanatum]